MRLAAVLVPSVIIVTCAVTGTVRAGAAQAGTRAGGVPAEVAAVHDGLLRVIDEATGRATVLARGPYYGQLGSAIGTPGFSADGSWVAYQETSSNGSSSVHVVSSSGAHSVTVAGAQGYAWSPVRDELAVSLPGSVELITVAGKVLERWAAPGTFSESFSPSGAQIAVGTRASDAPDGSLVVLTVGGRFPRAILSRTDYCQQPAGWTADGSRVLSWQDADCSGSIAADGLTLDAVPAAGGRPVSLGTTLAYAPWVLPVSGPHVLVNTGGDRIVADHKVLRSCDAATGTCTAFPLPAATTSLDPALASAAHELFEVRVPQSVQASDFVPQGTLWAGALSGSGEHQLTAAGTGVADPVPSADGSTVTFVRMTSATTATVDVLNVGTGQVRVLAPVDDVDYDGEFTAPAVLAVRP
jgi:hypothetical protein